MLRYIRDKTAAPYFSNLVWFIGNNVLDLDVCVRHDIEYGLLLRHCRCRHLAQVLTNMLLQVKKRGGMVRRGAVMYDLHTVLLPASLPNSQEQNN